MKSKKMHIKGGRAKHCVPAAKKRRRQFNRQEPKDGGQQNGWLCISRKAGEVVEIDALGERIAVRVISIKPSRVRLGFKARDAVSILRGELVDAEHAAGKELAVA
ncbi:MAG: carbon storage regulator [Pirellulales bacterium]|nr:carbon storage regulator [Pirellulales bacterium]